MAKILNIYQNTRKLAIVLRIVSDSRRENTIRSILVSVDSLCQSCGDIGSIWFSWNGRGGCGRRKYYLIIQYVCSLEIHS